ncbi:M48 family metallopeptidase [Streptomyces sp. L2]|uniref:M48 family metallopeptidase n=1 Tax=Streptomyces sp. L2 TaxID=2162665 RepID=UPI001F50954F|nr:M48 family metallopeptidase [Streptomyces sp. L2]
MRGRVERLRGAAARRHGEKLLTRMIDAPDARAHRDAPAVLALVLALVVHAVTVALAVGGLWCLVPVRNRFDTLLGIFLLAMAAVLRPRFRRLTGRHPLFRDEAPELFALVDEIARTVGTRGVDAIAVDHKVNAGVSAFGVRGRRLLTLGLPLWETLSPRQRIALLGHELGHYANGDTRRGDLLGTAFETLEAWRYTLAPIRRPNAYEMIAKLLYLVPRLLVEGVLMALDPLPLRAAQRAEYLADRMAARVGSTEAAVGLMDRLLVARALRVALQREASAAALGGPGTARAADARADGLWDRLREYAQSIPEYEYERRRRAGARRGHSVDSTHPPTHLRRACLLAGPPQAGSVPADARRDRLIDLELATARVAMARRIVRDGLGD